MAGGCRTCDKKKNTREQKGALAEVPSVIEGILVTRLMVKRRTTHAWSVHKKMRVVSFTFGHDTSAPVVGAASARECIDTHIRLCTVVGGRLLPVIFCNNHGPYLGFAYQSVRGLVNHGADGPADFTHSRFSYIIVRVWEPSTIFPSKRSGRGAEQGFLLLVMGRLLRFPRREKMAQHATSNLGDFLFRLAV